MSRRLPNARILFALLLGSAPAWGQEVDESLQPGVTRPLLELPILDLGESVADPEYGFEFRLPKGFTVNPDLDELRKSSITPESERIGSDGTPNKVQIYLYSDDQGSTILIRANEPALKIENAAELRNTLIDADKSAGNPTRPAGKLYRFNMRGGRLGFFAERELGNKVSGQITHYQYMAYMRSGTRSLLVQLSAPLSTFEKVADSFKASLGSFILREGRRIEVQDTRKAKTWPGFPSPFILANLAIAVALVGLLFWRPAS